MSVELVPSSRYSHAELAALFTASFEGYALPMEIDEATFSRMAWLFDFDLDASRVAVRDGREIGLVNLGIRGRGGWIGGMGVVPDERRRGVGRLLMEGAHDEARARGLDDVVLEVIDSNAPAIDLYAKLGYQPLRDLDVWSLDTEPAPTAAREVPAAEAHGSVRELRRAPEPWQRSDTVVERLLAAEPLRGLATDGGAAVVRVAAHGAIVEQLRRATRRRRGSCWRPRSRSAGRCGSRTSRTATRPETPSPSSAGSSTEPARAAARALSAGCQTRVTELQQATRATTENVRFEARVRSVGCLTPVTEVQQRRWSQSSSSSASTARSIRRWSRGDAGLDVVEARERGRDGRALRVAVEDARVDVGGPADGRRVAEMLRRRRPPRP